MKKQDRGDVKAQCWEETKRLTQSNRCWISNTGCTLLKSW